MVKTTFQEKQILEDIQNDSFKQGFRYSHEEEFIDIPIEYIPDYIKETSVYKDFLETIDNNNRISIPINKLPFPSPNKVILNINFLLIMDYWNVNPEIIFELFTIKKIIVCFYCEKFIFENSYLLEIYKLIPYKINSKDMLYYFIQDNQNLSIIKDELVQLFIINFNILNNEDLKYINLQIKEIYDIASNTYDFLKMLFLLCMNYEFEDSKYYELLSIISPEIDYQYNIIHNNHRDNFNKVVNLYINKMNKIESLSFKVNKKYVISFPWMNLDLKLSSKKSNIDFKEIIVELKSNRDFINISKNDESIDLYYIIINSYFKFYTDIFMDYDEFYYHPIFKDLVNNKKFVEINGNLIRKISEDKILTYYSYIFEYIETITPEKIGKINAYNFFHCYKLLNLIFRFSFPLYKNSFDKIYENTFKNITPNLIFDIKNKDELIAYIKYFNGEEIFNISRFPQIEIN